MTDDATERERAELARRFANRDETRRRAVDEVAAAPDAPDAPDDLVRPRYRALVRPWYDHDVGDVAAGCVTSGTGADDAAGHRTVCAAGAELTVYRVDAYWVRAAGERAHAPLGVTQVDVDVSHDPWLARDTVAAWLRLRAEPLPTHVAPEHVELYLELP